MATIPASTIAMEGFQVNRPPVTFDPALDLPAGFLEFLAPLHRRFAPWTDGRFSRSAGRFWRKPNRERSRRTASLETPSGGDGELSCRNGARTSATR